MFDGQTKIGYDFAMRAHSPRKSSGAGLGLLQMVRKNENELRIHKRQPQVQCNLRLKSIKRMINREMMEKQNQNFLVAAEQFPMVLIDSMNRRIELVEGGYQ